MKNRIPAMIAVVLLFVAPNVSFADSRYNLTNLGVNFYSRLGITPKYFSRLALPEARVLGKASKSFDFSKLQKYSSILSIAGMIGSEIQNKEVVSRLNRIEKKIDFIIDSLDILHKKIDYIIERLILIERKLNFVIYNVEELEARNNHGRLVDSLTKIKRLWPNIFPRNAATRRVAKKTIYNLREELEDALTSVIRVKHPGSYITVGLGLVMYNDLAKLDHRPGRKRSRVDLLKSAVDYFARIATGTRINSRNDSSAAHPLDTFPDKIAKLAFSIQHRTLRIRDVSKQPNLSCLGAHFKNLMSFKITPKTGMRFGVVDTIHPVPNSPHPKICYQVRKLTGPSYDSILQVNMGRFDIIGLFHVGSSSVTSKGLAYWPTGVNSCQFTSKGACLGTRDLEKRYSPEGFVAAHGVMPLHARLSGQRARIRAANATKQYRQIKWLQLSALSASRIGLAICDVLSEIDRPQACRKFKQ